MPERGTPPSASRGAGRVLAMLAGLHVEIGILVFCGLVIMGTGRTEGPVFDVVGPDVLPAATAAIVAAMVMAQILVQVRRDLRVAPPAVRVDPLALRNGVIFTAATLLFVAAVARGWLPFALATSAFMSLTTMLLANSFRMRDAGLGAGIGLALGVVLQVTFTRVLFIDLPG